ncbi:type II secretion system protein [Kineococcus sp. T13]|nr:type II secretion system F family protein [Kineococcus vitellinus]NAZ77303.1 type II secretion system protein [Kineococcus vitellinus]
MPGVAPEVLVAATAATAGLGLLLAVLGVLGRPAVAGGRPPWRRRTAARLSRQALSGVVAGLVVLLLTRWLVAAAGIGLLVAGWDRLVGGSADEGRGIARLEALATWTESLRDTIAGAIGLEQAIPATAGTSAAVLRPSLNLLVDRLRIREPLPDALLRFADDVDDPSADVVVAALVLNARLRGPGLRDVLTALAASTREELDVRRRIEASRRSIRRSVRIVLLIVLGVMGLLAVFNRDYVAPYSSVPGQLALLVVAGLFLLGLTWLRRLARVETHERFLAAAQRTAPGRPQAVAR